MDVKGLLDEIRPHFDVRSYTYSRSGNPSPEKKGAVSPIKWDEKVHVEYIASDSEARDDLIFFVKYNGSKEETVEVLRRTSKLLPGLSDTSVHWDQSFYLNLILHEFEYHVTCSVITLQPGSDAVDKMLMKISRQVYPSPNRRRMDKKKGQCDLVYPNIAFYVDNFEEIFSSLHLCAPEHRVAVQLMAINKRSDVNKVVFLGAVDHEKLVDAYSKWKQEQSSFTAKLGLLPRPKRAVHSTHQSYLFIQMRGPSGKGYAEMAVEKRSEFKPHPQSASVAEASGGQNTGGNTRGNSELRQILRLDGPNGKSSEEMVRDAGKTGFENPSGENYKPLSIGSNEGSTGSENSSNQSGGTSKLVGNGVAEETTRDTGRTSSEDPSSESDWIDIESSPPRAVSARETTSTTGKTGSDDLSSDSDWVDIVSNSTKAADSVLRDSGQTGFEDRTGVACAGSQGSDPGGGGGGEGGGESEEGGGGTAAEVGKNAESAQSKHPKKKHKKALSKIVKSHKSSSSPSPPAMSVYLTYVQLPWYCLVEDILNGTREQVF